ncbi:VCBS repeat-containing protein [Caproiciproducens sp. NJN-50]|uniref:FG-GAP repeat domain-containing protein n=1 Tax=Acutalibacteraceae TaxID=3082771 RepID=UPI000FFE3276|nr:MULTISPECIES: VCBS repeat-containing protein [Acutalibacteraceae]QAT50884.1 VCBS repeat-containing protein [Caproiciproducens sp. NJN-50]
MKRKTAVIAVLLLMVVSLSGCSFVGLDAQSLMHAPKPTGENEADIQSLLESTAGGKMTLKYPSAGEYRSAIIKHDLYGDQNDEAIAFYQKDDETSGINVMFMRQNGGKWESMGSFSNPASNVDRVCFGDLDGDGKDEVIVGWGSSLNNTGDICSYYQQNGQMKELQMNQSYTEMAVMDFDGDGRDEIFTASVTVGDQPASAQLLRVKGGAIEQMGSAPLDIGVTKYASVLTGLINEKQVGIVLDGVKTADTMVTELLYWDKKTKTLRSPFYDPRTKSAKSTERNTSVVSRDINGDRIIEIPMVTLMPGYSGKTADDSAYLTSWFRYDTDTETLFRVMSMFINYSDGYWFLVPDMWRGKVTTKLDPSSRMVTVYEWLTTQKNKAGFTGAPLLTIQTFPGREWDQGEGVKSYFKLSEKDNSVFAASLPTPDNPLSMTKSEIQEAFQVISQD